MVHKAYQLLIIESNPQTFVAKTPMLFYNIKNLTSKGITLIDKSSESIILSTEVIRDIYRAKII